MKDFMGFNTICINRNIVECKDDYWKFHQPDKNRINRNIVECKANYRMQWNEYVKY